MRNNDDFDEPNAAKAFGSIMNALDLRSKFEARKPVYATGIVVALVAVLGGVVWYSYPKETAQREVMNTPIVRADASDYRAAPTEPGGMAVPYRESTVFNTLREGEGTQAAQVENLLPQPEQPVSRDELFAGLKVDEAVPATTAATTPTTETAPGVTTETPVAATTTTTATTPVAVPEAVAGTAIPAEATATTATTTTTTSVVAPTATPAEPVKPETVAAVDSKATEAAKTEPAAGVQKIDDKPSASSGGFYVQLGSVKAREGADGEWKKLQKSFSALTPLSMRVQEANLGDKGIFYRIQGGPVTEAQAKSICESVKAQKPGGCLVVRQ